MRVLHFCWAHVLHDLRRARIGLMGHVLEAMYDMQVDPTAVSRTFGCHISLCEPDMLLPFYRNPDPADRQHEHARKVQTRRVHVPAQLYR